MTVKVVFVSLLDRPDTSLLPEIFTRWFANRGWRPRAHQLELLAKARAGRSVLLIAPTGGGKTLAGFLPTLAELSEGAAPRAHGLHTLYISPLKALAVDIARNLEIPVSEMGLPVRLETRTGDTPASKRQRQRRHPPDILLTTPEQLALLLASADAPYLFGTLRARGARRTSFAGHIKARRPALARPRASVRFGAATHHRGAVGDCGRARRSPPFPGAATAHRRGARGSDRGASRCGAARADARYDRASALGRALGAACARRDLRAHQVAQDDAHFRQHPQPGRIPLPGTMERERRQSRHRAASRLARCRRSAARSRTP